ncbi:MAG: adenylate/guanylate cyclase domain-containing protein [Nitrospirae bacterium]|nr:adenylate/guanylate cyclase domain-containing protein [Nitrospirota bacterium]
MASARSIISKDLIMGSKVFYRIMDNRKNQLSENTKILSMDFAFKQSILSADYETLLSIVDNLKDRVKADYASLVSLEYTIMADTLQPDLRGKRYASQELIEKTEEEGEVSSITTRDGGYFQIVIVPILAPDPIAWLVIGFMINDTVLKDISSLIIAQISVFHLSANGKLNLVASTLSEDLRKYLVGQVNVNILNAEEEQSLRLGQSEYISFISLMEKRKGSSFFILLQRSLNEVLRPYNLLRTRFAIITLISLLISFVVSIRISRSVTKPVSTIVVGVRQIENGNYNINIEVNQKDELGELSTAFNNMARGLQERDLVSDLLGKVVSPAIAKELLSKKVELGGEEKEVTILFSDIRSFTTLSENTTPTMILNLLNRYLTVMSEIIERHGGVIDKYIGDAIMALFGAPISHPDDVDRALNAALDMTEELEILNMDFQKSNIPPINIGIGINTDIVVAGNMGSVVRHNYTVIGDGVNLASRLEGLTKNYNTRIIISESTYKKAKEKYTIEQLGEVLVKGKHKPTVIYALTGRL